MEESAYSDEPADPRAIMQRQAQQMAQQLMKTVELPAKLGWEEFDFGVDLFDPFLDDVQGVIGSGKADRETLSALFQIGLGRHCTLEARYRLLRELESKAQGEIRLDVRSEVSFVQQALHQLSIPPSSIGLIWALYPRHAMFRLQERHKLYRDEEAGFSAEDHALVDGFGGRPDDAEKLRQAGGRAMALIDRIIQGWAAKAPAVAAAAREACALASQWPGLRMARTLSSIFWQALEDGVFEAARKSLRSMRESALTALELDLTMHDPPPEVRRRLYPVLVDLRSRVAVARMVEDVSGVGGWSQPGKGADHAKAVLVELMRADDRRAVPMLLHVMARRPPPHDVRQAIQEAFGRSPMKEEFERGLRDLEAGKPVVVPAGTPREEFMVKHGSFSDRMKQEKFQAELIRVTRLWESCYHEELGWRSPAQMAEQVGPREREIRTRLSEELKAVMGRMVGRAPAAALEEEFRTQWMVTPHNDVSGRVPLAVIFDERAGRGDHPDVLREEREQQASELYTLALRAVEGKMEENARRDLKAILQLVPGHPFAQDALERLERGESPAGVAAGAARPQPSRLIIP